MGKRSEMGALRAEIARAQGAGRLGNKRGKTLAKLRGSQHPLVEASRRGGSLPHRGVKASQARV